MPLIRSEDYDFIRKRIHASANDSTLPPSLIESYLPESERWVAKRVTVADLDEDQLFHAQEAAKYYCASRIALVWSPPTSESVPGAGTSWSQKVVDPTVKSAELRTMAEAELNEATPAVETVRAGRTGSAQTVARW